MAAEPRRLLRQAFEQLRPPPRLSLSEWADEHFRLSAESSADPGRWRTLPYQRGIMDAITDPTVTFVTLMKSARVGATQIMKAGTAYYIHQDPCPILNVQPTVDNAKEFSKEDIATMLRDVPAISDLVPKAKGRDSKNSLLHKSFPGGVLSLVGANSGAGLRRISRRVVFLDEVDAYPASAGNDGDPVRLAIKRTEYFWNRKIVAASTPLIAAASRIEQLYESGDQRRYYVPCPQCGHRDYLVFSEPNKGEPGHWMAWPEAKPEDAHLVCSANGCVIEERHKRQMLEQGEWVAHAEFRGHASFHIWAAYSLSPNASWGQIAAEFVEANRDGPEALKTWVNTTLGETWQERGEAPDYERLFARREPYPIGSVPDGVVFVTAGVDVQNDRWVYEVVGWNARRESWSIDAGIIFGDTADADEWAQLDDLLSRSYDGHSIARLAIDSGYAAQMVYAWARRHPKRVMACKGMSRHTLITTPTKVDVTIRGKTLKRGCWLWGLGEGVAKSELYGWLGLELPDNGEPYPKGFCHFPEYDKEYFRQLTSEHLVKIKMRSGIPKLEWQLQPGRENHYLDCRILARAAAEVVGLSRMKDADRPRPAADPAPSTDARVPISKPRKKWQQRERERRQGWL